MSKFFPQSQRIKIDSDIELLAFQCQDTVFQFAYIAPGASLKLHQHPESQIGMVISGKMEMNINGHKEILKPLQQVYAVGANVPHGAVNCSAETIFSLDVKRLVNLSVSEEILNLSPTKDTATDLIYQAATGSWFEIAIAKIPPGLKIKSDRSDAEEIGIVFDGKMLITVGNEQQQVKTGEIYYAPANIVNQGYNLTTEEVTLIKILFVKQPLNTIPFS
ncbi:MAG: cupin domain-containing protein [Microcoleus sp.]